MSKKKKRVPIKNVDPVLVDVRKPGFSYQKRIKFARLNLSQLRRNSYLPPKPYKKFIKWGTSFVVLVLILISLFTLFNVRQIKAVFLLRGERVINNFISSVEALKGFKSEEAAVILGKNAEELSHLNAIVEKPTYRIFLGVLGSILPTFKEAGNFFSQVTKLNLNFINLAEAISDLEKRGFYYFQHDGESLLARLSDIRALIGKINEQIEVMKNTTAELKSISSVFSEADELISGQYLKYSSELQNLDNFLAAIYNVFGSEEEKHILLIFHNPAEIRPAGGFIGSYADLIISEGQMTGMEVQDIYWPDHPMNLDLKVVPPEPLQAVTTDWGARDANWFFDFPTSARTVIDFLESSKIYKEENVTFEGVIALNIRVIETILDFLGPIGVDEYGLVVDKDNFLIEIQREVEAGRDKKPGENPKRILSVLTPIMLEGLSNLSELEQKNLFEKLKNHFIKKDIMVFSKVPSLASFFNSLNIDGAVYKLPTSFWGSYLAVVNANIAGGKSDAFVEESVVVNSDIDTDGGVFTDLTVTRTHNGNTQKDPWWRVVNQNYIQIFTNPGSMLVSLKGNDVKRFTKPNYDREGYSVNVDLEKIESTKILLADYNTWSMNAFGKNVFTTWWKIPAGETEKLNLRYQTPSSNQTAPALGKKFRFIFERQSGVKNNLKIKLSAPLGYRWAESESPIFSYESDDPNARVILDLTLIK